MIGDGHLKEEIHNKAKELNLLSNITFYGGLPFKEAQSVLAKCHVLIMPGVMEGWPKPIAESWAHNCLPLAANKGNVPDIIDTKNKGLCFEPTAEELSKTIKKAFKYLLENKEKINLTKFAIQYSLENFQIKLSNIIKSLQ
ncbi:glycosyltransferase [uncultured Polaribacter sp.]|uniref:glycosyltransferase n=1 Tax=uncultured Polaribacter sp. TaxID=174711 RepID=UPI0026260F50|nr:glycosyltransferase [uncultured Polaribacter sp.]